MAEAQTLADTPALEMLTARIMERAEHVVDEMVSTYREEIDDYRTLDEDTVYGDVASVALDNLRMIATSAERGGALDPEALERFRLSAARRVHQGIALDNMLSAYATGSRIIWDCFRRLADPFSAEDSRALLVIADALFRHLNAVSQIVASAYISETRSVDRGSTIPRRDLLDALLSGDIEGVALDPHSLAGQSDLAPGYAVVVARATGTPGNGRVQSERIRRLRAIERAQQDLRPRRGSVLTGLRDGDVIALLPLNSRDELVEAAERSDRFAAGLAEHGFVVGLSGWHPGHDGVPSALREAQSAVDIGQAMGTTARCVRFDEVVVEHIMRTSPYAGALLEDIVGRLRSYDDAGRADLLPTLRGYIDADLNVTRTAAAMHVHPNTVTYRLRRIAELTQRDPMKADDLVVLMIALKADELNARGSAVVSA